MKELYLSLLFVYMILLGIAFVTGWDMKAPCSQHFTTPMSYALGIGWYPSCEMNNFKMDCPNGWEKSILCPK